MGSDTGELQDEQVLPQGERGLTEVALSFSVRVTGDTGGQGAGLLHQSKEQAMLVLLL
jgi:hypothetical protein